MKMNILKLAMIAFTLTCGGQAFAQSADDTAWIERCVRDNKREGATPAVVRAYCTCMNGEMSDNENLSLSLIHI